MCLWLPTVEGAERVALFEADKATVGKINNL